MKFKIDLHPYPGAPYFTVREHLRMKTTKLPADKYLADLEQRLRTLFHVPEEYGLEILDLENKKEYLSQFQAMIIKDDPNSGLDNHAGKPGSYPKAAVLDLSYSFPQIPENLHGFDAIVIDPNASLGVPSRYFMVFSQNRSMNLREGDKKNEAFLNDTWLLSRVLNDLGAKGLDVLVRESNYKAAVLYQMIENCKSLLAISETGLRSKTMILATGEYEFIHRINSLGYSFPFQREKKNTRITIANYPTHSKELIEMFADRVTAL